MHRKSQLLYAKQKIIMRSTNTDQGPGKAVFEGKKLSVHARRYYEYKYMHGKITKLDI